MSIDSHGTSFGASTPTQSAHMRQLSLLSLIGTVLLLAGCVLLGVGSYTQIAEYNTSDQRALLGDTLYETQQLPPPDTTITQGQDTTTTNTDQPLPPTVQFIVSGGDINLAETLYVKPSRGTQVKAFIQNRAISLNTQLDLKQASPTSLSWSFVLRTDDLPTGEYNFMAQVYANDIWHEIKGEKFYIIAANETQSSNTFSYDSVNESGEGVVDESVIFPSLPPTLTGEQAIVMQLFDVTRPVILIRDITKRVVLELRPETIINTMYVFPFDTRKLPNAKYTLESKYQIDGVAKTTLGPTITVKNFVATGATTTNVTSTSTNTTTSEDYFVARLLTTDTKARYQTFMFVGNDISYVEVYTRSSSQTEPTLVGQAKRQLDNLWNFTIDTASLPVGTYQLIAKYKRDTQLITHNFSPTFTVNKPVPVDTTTLSDPITEAVENIKPVVDAAVRDANQVPPPPLPTLQPKTELSTLRTTAEPEKISIEPQNIPRVATNVTQKPIITANQKQIDEALARYTSALRSGDAEAIKRARLTVLALGVSLAFAEEGGVYSDASEVMNTHLEELLERAERIEKIVQERTLDQIAKDSDSDGITDFDEVTLYKTEPQNADTDSDGFQDGAEILAGFDPKSSNVEVAVVYESPKEAGVERADVLRVDNVAAIIEAEPEDDGVLAQAQITGVGLPNSFVTLFIFSTPVVVTLKTADDGSWVYKFDKELEDGEHEVYVGVTDNAGAIVAKSSPFRFVKEAEAFAPITDQAATYVEEVTPQGVESPRWMLMIIALVILLVGAILLLLGAQVERNRRSTRLPEIT